MHIALWRIWKIADDADTGADRSKLRYFSPLLKRLVAHKVLVIDAMHFVAACLDELHMQTSKQVARL